MGGGVMADKRNLEVIWDVLHEWQDYQEHVLNQVDKEAYEERWDDICTAMAWIKEDLEDLQYANKTSDSLLSLVEGLDKELNNEKETV
jgi:hypothetical protein